MASQPNLIDRHRPPSVTSWSQHQSLDPNEDVYFFDFSQLSFRLALSHDHNNLISCTVWDRENSIRRRDLDIIRQDVRAIFHSIYTDSQHSPGELNIQIAILQALERIAGYIGPEIPVAGKQSTSQKKTFAKGWSPGEISDWDDVINNPYGLDATTIRDEAFDLLGKTPQQIVAMIPSEWRVIHMESVIRPDLLKRFRRYQSSLFHSLDSAHQLRSKMPPHSKLGHRVRASIPKQDIIDDMAHPRVTFHGTPLKSVRSIIRHGFILPGRFINGSIVASPRSGIAFDRGIYSSQSPAYAMSYASGQREQTPLGMIPSMRLFVCATIMGRTYTRGPGVHGPLVDGYDSHFDGDFEYVVHEERAMLPCYVIHLDLGSEAAIKALKSAQNDPNRFRQEMDEKKERSAHPRLSQTRMAPGDAKREQEARKAAAMKWFPYGFGPATGTRFVIEEVGEVSEDDEEYGEWQADKHAFIAVDKDNGDVYPDSDGEDYYWSCDEDGNSVKKKRGFFMDQYQAARR